MTESHGFSRTLPIKATVVPAQVLPEVTPQQINIGMLAGETRNVALSIRNLGSEAWRGVSLTAPALSWVSIQGGTQLGDIAPGGNANVSLQFAPLSGLANGTYSPAPLIQVMSQNQPPIGISAAVAVTSSRTGDVLVSVINADQPKNLSGQGVPVAGAKVTLFERESTCGYHSTGRSAALFTECYGDPVVRRLAMAGRDFFEHPPRGFIDDPLVRPRPVMFVATFAQRAELAVALADYSAMVPAVTGISAAQAVQR